MPLNMDDPSSYDFRNLRPRLPKKQGSSRESKFEARPAIDDALQLLQVSLTEVLESWSPFTLAACYVFYGIEFSIPDLYVSETKEDAHFKTVLLPRPQVACGCEEWAVRMQLVDRAHSTDFYSYVTTHYAWDRDKGLFGKLAMKPVPIAVDDVMVTINTFYPISNIGKLFPHPQAGAIAFRPMKSDSWVVEREKKLTGEIRQDIDRRKLWDLQWMKRQ